MLSVSHCGKKSLTFSSHSSTYCKTWLLRSAYPWIRSMKLISLNSTKSIPNWQSHCMNIFFLPQIELLYLVFNLSLWYFKDEDSWCGWSEIRWESELVCTANNFRMLKAWVSSAEIWEAPQNQESSRRQNGSRKNEPGRTELGKWKENTNNKKLFDLELWFSILDKKQDQTPQRRAVDR